MTNERWYPELPKVIRLSYDTFNNLEEAEEGDGHYPVCTVYDLNLLLDRVREELTKLYDAVEAKWQDVDTAPKGASVLLSYLLDGVPGVLEGFSFGDGHFSLEGEPISPGHPRVKIVGWMHKPQPRAL